MTAIEEEAAIRQRRRVVDVDVDAYLNLKKKLNGYITLIAQGKQGDISLDDLKSIELESDRLKLKIFGNIQFEMMKYLKLFEDFENFDTLISDKQDGLIEAKTVDNELLDSKISKIGDLLVKRRNINDLIKTFLQNNQQVELTRYEIVKLFGTEIDPQQIIKIGKLTKRGTTQDQDVLSFPGNSGLLVSCDRLQRSIDLKLNECQQLKEKIRTNKSKWEKISVELQKFIENVIKLNE